MAFTESPQFYCSESVVPAANALDAGTVGVRFPVVSRLTVFEYGVRVVTSTATGTTFTLVLKGEPVAGGSAVTLSTLTGATTITQGQAGRRYCEVNVDPNTYSFITLTATNGTASATGVLYFKYRQGGSFTTETNDVIFTS